MKKNKLITTALSLSLLGAVAIPSAIFADSDVSDSANTSTTETQDAGTTTAGDHVITPQRSMEAIDAGITGGATVQTSFEIPRRYGYIKLKLKNYSDHTATVNLTHIQSNKEYIDRLEIPPHDTVIWKSADEGYSNGMRSGDYTLEWRGGDYRTNGHVYGTVATSPGNL
ncbi:UNVERIFIED_CONTAM: hypothetical protein ABIC26_004157 [Paenibacillus sp. PvR008]